MTYAEAGRLGGLARGKGSKGAKVSPKKANKTVAKKLRIKGLDAEISKLEKHLSGMARSEGMGTNRYQAGSEILAKMRSMRLTLI